MKRCKKKMMNRVFIETLGCPKNEYDSLMLKGLLEKRGYEVSEFYEDANYILINTCGFINDAKVESINTIFDYIRVKDDKTIIVSGCLSERYRKDLFEEIPEVDILIGVNDYHNLPDILDNYHKGNRVCQFSSSPKTFDEYYNEVNIQKSFTQTVKLAEGCDHNCAYCVIPKIRGGYRSRRMEDIVSEVYKMSENGCREIILIAQDTTNYGRDIYSKFALPELINKISEIEKIKWIRLMYCYEDKITDELIDVIKNNKKVCKYLDMPIQHLSNNVLKLMNRNSTNKSILNTIKSLRDNVENIHIRTTILTGFPGETEEDFEELLEGIEEISFERLGVFSYSREEDTKAYNMDNQVDEDEKIYRKNTLLEKQMYISQGNNLSKIGDVVEVLVEYFQDDHYIGRTQWDAPGVDNTVIFSSDKKINFGDFVKVKVIDSMSYDLIGEVI